MPGLTTPPMTPDDVSHSAASSDVEGGDPESARRLATVVYALQAASFLLALTLIVGVVINYVKRADVQGTPVESHFRWQIRTFWFTLLWGLIGSLTTAIGIGYLILIATGVWLIYRIVKGWLRLNDGKGVGPP